MDEQGRVDLTADDLDIHTDETTEFTVLVEFPEQQEAFLAGEESARGALSDMEERSRQAIEAAMRTIRAMAVQTDRMRNAIPEGAQPDVATIKFGVKLDVKAGALLASSGIGAALEVELVWKRRSGDTVAPADRQDAQTATEQGARASDGTDSRQPPVSPGESPEEDAANGMTSPAGIEKSGSYAQGQHPALARDHGRANFYALLIGIDHYANPDSRALFKPLSGCVRDVEQVDAYLSTRLERPPDVVVKLTASDGGGDEPEEPPAARPTYANIVGAFNTITSIAQPGDHVYIHYSGHGGRAATGYPDIKGDITEYDESLVPSDYNLPGGNYLRDVQLAYLLQQMVDKELVVTVVLDSCHSAGAARGDSELNAAVRGALEPDNTPRTVDDLVATPAELARFWREIQAASGGAGESGDAATRNAKPASGWLIEPRGYVLLAACRANELAYEFAFDGQHKSGALTHWMLDTLRNAGPDFTYRMVHNRVSAKVHTQFVRQSPQLQGEADRTLFTANKIVPTYAINVLMVDGNRVQLQAGAVHGLKEGDRFTVYPAGNVGIQAHALAQVELASVDGSTAWATVIAPVEVRSIREGDQAVLDGEFRIQRGVAVIASDSKLRHAVEQAILARGNGFLHVKEPSADSVLDFQVVLADGTVEIWDAAGVPIPNLRPAISAGDADAVPKVVDRLVHLAKYRDVQEMDAPSPRIQGSLTVELELPDGRRAADGAGVAHPGDLITLHISNHDSTQPVNVAVLDLQPDWGISQLFPAGASHEVVEPGATIPVRFRAYLPEGYTQGTDIFKIMATRQDTDYFWLQLPALGKPDHSQRSDTVPKSPLERMFQEMTNGQAALRNGHLVDDAEWTVVQVELPVEDPVSGGGE